jgi:hypothetical protein
MAFLWRMLGYPPPPGTITDRQIDVLLDVPSVYYPPITFGPLVRAELKKHIKANWATRPGQKTPAQLMGELLHECTQEYMTRLVLGDRDGVHKGINARYLEKKAAFDEEKNPAYKAGFQKGIDYEMNEISKFFTEGYTRVFKESLLFDVEGRPIGVLAGSDREERFPLCHRRLAEDDAVRRGPRVDLEADPLGGAGGVPGADPLRSAGGTRRKRRQLRRKRSRRSSRSK